MSGHLQTTSDPSLFRRAPGGRGRGILRRAGLALVLLGLFALTGLTACASMNGLTTGRAVAKNHWEFVVGISFAPDFSKNDMGIPGLPVLDLLARFGVDNRTDVGVRLNTMGWFMVDAKIEAYDSKDFTAAIKPGVGFSIINAVSGSGVLQVELVALFDGHVGGSELATDAFVPTDATITLAPKYVMFINTDGSPLRHFLGASLYGKISLDKPHHTLTPFASVLADVGSDEEADMMRVTLMTNFGIAYGYSDSY